MSWVEWWSSPLACASYQESMHILEAIDAFHGTKRKRISQKRSAFEIGNSVQWKNDFLKSSFLLLELSLVHFLALHLQ